jgi:hypothetical protein
LFGQEHRDPDLTLAEAERMVIKTMREQHPGKVLDPEIVRAVAEIVVQVVNEREHGT